MKFARIEMLFLIWIVPLLVIAYFYGWRKRRRILHGYAHQRTLANIVPPGLGRRRRTGAIMILLAIIFAIFAMTGPQYGFHWQEIERKGIDIVIALDCSRSMLASDIQPTRLDRAKREIYDLLNMLQGDRVGLVAFSGAAFLQCPLTIDYPAFYLFLDVLAPDYLPVGGSDLAAALQNAQAAFDPQSNADKAIILITDGEHTGKEDPMATAQAVLKSGIKLFTIGVGSGEGVPVPEANGGFKKDRAGQIVLSRMDESLLTRMALTTGGSYVRSVAGDMDLETIYSEEIRGRMESAAVKSGRKRIWADRYQWPLALAIAMLLLTRWIRPTSHAAGLALALAFVCIFIPLAPAEAGPLQKGYDAYQGGAYEKALDQFIDGQLQEPEDPSLLYNIGNTYYKMENYDAATEHFLQALPKASPDLKPRLLYNLGNSSYRRGRFKEAIENYEFALKLAPDDSQIKENLAFVRKQLQEQENRQPGQDGQDNDESKPPQSQDQQQQNQEGGQSSREPEQNPDHENWPPSSGDNADSDKQQAPKPDPKDEGSQAGNRSDSPDRSGSEDRKAAQKAAAQMLNRLKDQPGRALMPDYKKRVVEKDW